MRDAWRGSRVASLSGRGARWLQGSDFQTVRPLAPESTVRQAARSLPLRGVVRWTLGPGCLWRGSWEELQLQGVPHSFEMLFHVARSP